MINNANYSGVNSQQLQLISLPSSAYGYKYRCIVDGANSYVFSLKFSNTWNGTFSNSWENPLNWSCHYVPDANTEVIIEGGTISINSDAIVRKMTVKPGAIVTIEAGHNLTVLY